MSDDLASVNGGGAGVSIYPKHQRKRTESPFGVESDGEDEETKIMHFLSGVSAHACTLLLLFFWSSSESFLS